MKFIFTVLFTLIAFSVYSQVISVTDNTGKAVENVIIYTETKTRFVQTNLEGNADISNLQGDIIYFQHPSFIRKAIDRDSIQQNNFHIELTDKIVNIDEIVVSANKWEQDKSEIPVHIHAITPEEIKEATVQTSADLLQNTGKVYVQKSQYGGGSPMIRGFAANSVLLVVDGVRMNNAIFRGGNLQNIINIDPNIVSSAEVIYGPGSTIYGSDALGGVMDFHTRDVSLSYSDNRIFKSGYMARYASASNENTGHFDLEWANKNFGSLTSITYSKFGDLKAGSNRPHGYDDIFKRAFYVETRNGIDVIVPNPDPDVQTPSGFNQLHLMQKFRYKLKNYDLIFKSIYSTTSGLPRYDRLIELEENGTPSFAEWEYGPQSWWMNTLTVKTLKPAAFYDEAKLTLGYQLFRESRIARDFGVENREDQEENVQMGTINLDLNKTVFNKLQLFYGLEGVYNDISSVARNVNILTGEISEGITRYPDGGSYYQSFAGYFSGKYNLNSRLFLTGGLRYTNTLLGGIINENRNLFSFTEFDIQNHAFTGSAGVTFKPNNSWKIDGSLSSGFRSPNIDDVGKVFRVTSEILVVPNMDLKPEYTYNAESGLSYKNSFLTAEIRGFYTLIENVISRENFRFNGMDSVIYNGVYYRTQAQVNSSQGYIYGANFSINAAVIKNYLGFNTHFTIMDGKNTSNNEPLRHVAPYFGKISLLGEYKTLKSELFLLFNGPRAWEDLPSEEQDKPFIYTRDGTLAWQTFNYRISWEVIPNLNISMAVENIFDLHYRTYSSGISAPGRNWIVMARYFL